MLGYFFAIIPLYIFVYLPISNILFGAPQTRQLQNAEFFLNTSFIATEDAESAALQCTPHAFSTHILNLEPLVIYIEDFLSEEEREHLVNVSQESFEPSTVTTGAETTINKEVRFSEVALLERDNVVRCIEQRARAFQGWRRDLHVERLRTQRYGAGGHYRHHYDWSGASRSQDRVSTFMVYIAASADIEGGGTEFPRLRRSRRRDQRWCRFVDCETEADHLVFTPVPGNAVFWLNLRPDGRGYEETWHAGLPVTQGEKIGLNIWSWGPPRDV
ncbi:2OG-Fe(II)oxygenase family Oxidoreductase [Phlyctema vagabunda]|uniref:2OG-Fe(II)oxygenase family Oxidoreductase n=1 Tax=Phlyctema vagabunda TaxID=108571 RepID=A0ABR4PPE4_9HELO